MLEASLTAWTTRYRCTASQPHWAHGQGELSVGRAPRIHCELLKLGFTVSARTVSRYLPHRLTTPSQTWCTFLANHIGMLAFTSSLTSSFATSDDDVDASVLPCRSVAPSRDGRYASTQWALVEWPPSRQRRSLVQSVVQDHRHNCTRIPPSQGRDPPKSSAALDLVPNACGRRFFSPRNRLAQRARDWSK